VATATTSVKNAFDTQADLKDHREHCAPAARTLASLGSGPGQQVRIHRDDEFALYTVSELLHETTDAVVRMGLGGRQRLQTEEEFEGVLDTKVVDPDLCDKKARDAGELVERLDDDGSQTHLIAIAPHGGDIEEHTDAQAERVAERLGPQLASAWRGKGWGSDGGAFVRWHITSTDLNPVCFPLLNSVISRRFAHAVAFHGFNDEPGVLIGGTAPAEVKAGLRQAIQQVLPAGFDVRVALPAELFGGDDPNNIVNRLSPCGGIQIEQGPSPRGDYGCDIADVVADFFRPATAPSESWARHGIKGVLARVWEAAQSLVDRLRGRHRTRAGHAQREGSEWPGRCWEQRSEVPPRNGPPGRRR
jgi:phage replication-related protein YjqB (UPF0714/DUF867 family)